MLKRFSQVSCYGSVALFYEACPRDTVYRNRIYRYRIYIYIDIYLYRYRINFPSTLGQEAYSG